jgi:polyphosphate kinase 2 (PPK2 family)
MSIISRTKHAPWYVVPANRKWYRNLVVAEVIVDALKDLHLKHPPIPKGIDWNKLKID